LPKRGGLQSPHFLFQQVRNNSLERSGHKLLFKTGRSKRLFSKYWFAARRTLWTQFLSELVPRRDYEPTTKEGHEAHVHQAPSGNICMHFHFLFCFGRCPFWHVLVPSLPLLSCSSFFLHPPIHYCTHHLLYSTHLIPYFAQLQTQEGSTLAAPLLVAGASAIKPTLSTAMRHVRCLGQR
jgi:hypothetical protein